MNINEAKKVIAAAALAGDTVIMEGPHGIGKSTSVKQFAKENNYYCQELFLSHMEVGDVIGIPRTIEQHGEVLTTWTKPIWLQRMIDKAWPMQCKFSDLSFANTEIEAAFLEALGTRPSANTAITREEANIAYAKAKGYDNIYKLHLVSPQVDIFCKLSVPSVLFLDELNRAPIDVRQSSLQLVLEKQIHEHELPYVAGRAAMIVAAINPADSYQVDTLDAALLDRFLHISVEADAKAWLEYARTSNLNEIVRAYIAEHPKDIFSHIDSAKDPISATPRSWEKLASFMDIADKIEPSTLFSCINGKIGKTLGAKFVQFYNSYAKVIKMADVEKTIAKEMKKSKNPEDIAKAVAKQLEKQEPIVKTEMAEQFLDKYIKKTGDDALPLLAYLYSLDIELLATFLKGLRNREDQTNYNTLAKLDEPQKKALFRKITSLAK